MSVSEATLLELVDCVEGHLDDIMAIEVEAYPDPWALSMFRQEIRSPRSYFYTALLDETLVGYAGFWLVLDEAHITSVAVRQGLRRRGYGRHLVLHLLRVAAAVGARRATLEVRGSNHAAQALYEGLGFEVTGSHKGYYPKAKEDAVIMMKELGPQQSMPDRDKDI